ncbi:hypothetical protein AH295_004774, partial [Salmonella enterica subsp. enterica]|nr:hypothetical protein [Salmonella enterica subsp. enterica]
SCHPLSRRSCVEGRSITITDEFRIASGYGSVMVLVNGLEPLPIRLIALSFSVPFRPITTPFSLVFSLVGWRLSMTVRAY